MSCVTAWVSSLTLVNRLCVSRFDMRWLNTLTYMTGIMGWSSFSLDSAIVPPFRSHRAPWWQPLIIISSWDHLFPSNMVDGVYQYLHEESMDVGSFSRRSSELFPRFWNEKWSRQEKESHLVIFLVTSQTRHILSRGNSFFRAVLWTMKIWRWEGCCQRWYWWCCWWDIENADDDATCIIAVRNDCGLKNPGSQTEIGRLKSPVQPFRWWGRKLWRP